MVAISNVAAKDRSPCTEAAAKKASKNGRRYAKNEANIKYRVKLQSCP